MADFDYNIRAVRHTCAQHAMRAAVLLSVYSPRALSDVPAYMGYLRTKWQRRLAVWRAGGVSCVQGKAFQYARNCPPFGVITDDREHRSCRRALVCPFCWARRVVLPVYQHAERMLGAARRLTLPPGFVLVEFKTLLRTYARDDTWSPVLLRDALQARRVALRRTAEYDHYRAVAGVLVLRVQPEERHLSFWRSGLLLVPSAHWQTGLLYTAGRHTSAAHLEMSRKQLANVVGRICSYSAGVLQAEPWEVQTLLTQFHGVRMFSARTAAHRRSQGSGSCGTEEQ